ncbi:EamA family transporter [Desulfovibrio sp. MES5]|uniref:DMT family transporter n=1 Tax=Desulfovibrio sp. MES5 TaxID=1899016 RepID=UPI0025C646E4|nr:EamA family transporter [Desulfovibrio sp. MES5]
MQKDSMAGSPMLQVNPQSSGYVWILFAAFFWSLLGVASKFCIAGGLLPLETAFWRAAIGCICFIIHAAITGSWRVSVRDAIIFMLFGLWGTAVFFAAMQISIKLSGGGTAVVLLYTAPVWVAFFSRILFKERITKRKVLAIGIALCGTALVCFTGGSIPGEASIMGILFGLLAGFCYATHYPFYRWWQARYSTAAIYAYMLLGGCIALGLFEPIHINHSLDIWAWLIVLGFLTCYLAYFCYGMGLKRISLVRAAVTCHLEPVLGTLWVWLFWDENFTPLGWLGCALVLGAVLLLTTDKSKE